MLHGKKDATKKHEIMCSCMGRTRDGGQDEKVQEISGVASEIKNESECRSAFGIERHST